MRYYSFSNLIIIKKDLFLSQSFDHLFTIFMVLNNGYQLFFIFKQIIKLKDKIIR